MRASLLLFLAFLVSAGCATPSITSEGLVATRSNQLDEVYLRPNADFSAHRRVVIDAVPVQFRSDWLTRRHAYNRLQEPYPPYQDPQATARDLGAITQAGLAEAFAARGYEVVRAPGPGVLQISARITELFINAPDRLSSSMRATLTRDAGQATLSLEARDPGGVLLARIEHHGIAREVTRLSVADDASNRLWLDTMLRRWAVNCAAQFGASRRTEISLAR
jgi:hypothetical protein